MAFGISGGALFVERFVLHQPTQIDGLYKTLFLDTFQERAQQSIAGMARQMPRRCKAQLTQIQAWMLSPEGHAAFGLRLCFQFSFSVVLRRRRRSFGGAHAG